MQTNVLKYCFVYRFVSLHFKQKNENDKRTIRVISVSVFTFRQTRRNIWIFSPKTLLPVNKQTKIGAAVGEEPALHHWFTTEATNVCINSFGKEKKTFFYKIKKNKIIISLPLYSAVHNTIYKCPTRQNYKTIPNYLFFETWF